MFDGQVFVGLQARDAAMDYASLNAAVTEEMIKANVYKIYYQLAVGKKQLEVFDINIARTSTLLHNTEEMYKNGFQEKLDVDKLLVNLSNLRTDKLKLENRLKTGNVGLKYLLGMPVKEVLNLTDTVSEASIKEDLLSGDSASYENRKEYQLLKTTEKLNQYNIKRYQMGYIPTVSLTGSYSQNAQRNKFNFFKGGEAWFKSTYIGLRIDVPIFDGFSKDAKIKRHDLSWNKRRPPRLIW